MEPLLLKYLVLLFMLITSTAQAGWSLNFFGLKRSHNDTRNAPDFTIGTGTKKDVIVKVLNEGLEVINKAGVLIGDDILQVDSCGVEGGYNSNTGAYIGNSSESSEYKEDYKEKEDTIKLKNYERSRLDHFNDLLEDSIYNNDETIGEGLLLLSYYSFNSAIHFKDLLDLDDLTDKERLFYENQSVENL